MVERAGHASLIGRQLGNYAVERLLGRGATGAVYLAHDTALGRPVALKVLLGSLARNPDQVARFLEEARALAPLQHPHIVGVYEAGVRDGIPFIAMEYIRGEALDRFLRRNTPLDWRHALYIATQVADALQCAHQSGIVHRDIKPANILLDAHGHVRLMDFGIARMQEDQKVRGQSYAFFGTPEYMSPEQCGSSIAIGPRSDFFSLGVMVYQMISATMPFQGQHTPALIRSIASHTPPRLNRLCNVPDDVARLVAALLEKEPERRPTDAGAIRVEIARLLKQDGGASAVPEALNTFIRDMAAQPITPSGTTPVPGVGNRRFRLIPERRYLAPVSTLAQGLLVALIAFACFGAGYWHLVKSPQASAPAVIMEGLEMPVAADGARWAYLPATHWAVDSIHWVGEKDVALVSVVGRPGTPFQGSEGLLAMTPDSGTVYSVSVPVGPISDADIFSGMVLTPRAAPMPVRSPNTPLSNAFVIPFAVAPDSLDGKGGLIQAVVQRWDSAQPEAAPVFSIERQAAGSRFEAENWLNDEPALSVAIHPDGHTLCLLLHDSDQGIDYLAERDVRWKYPSKLGRRLTTADDPIDGASIRYSDGGEKLAYKRVFDARESSLWVIDTVQFSPNGIPVATGEIGDYAFSPDGKQLAVTRLRDGVGAVCFVDTTRPGHEENAGAGHCGAGSWHPTDDQLLVRAPDPDTGEQQLWSLYSTPPYRRTRLTALESGAQGAPTVSRTGRWFTTVTDTDRGQAVVFIPWAEPSAPQEQKEPA